VIRDGGCPGEEVIAAFLNAGAAEGHKVVSLGDIRLALATFRESGELAAWHATHNPGAKLAFAPVVHPEAVKQFTRTHHVKAFVEAVKVNEVPFDRQPAYAEAVVAALTDNRPVAASPRRRARPEGFDSSVPRDERLTAVNIRRKVEQQIMAEPRNERLQASIEERERMTSLEQGLDDVWRGVSRAIVGFRKIEEVVEVLGGLEGELSVIAAANLRRVREAVAELDDHVARFKGKARRGGNGTREAGKSGKGGRDLLQDAR
jgi:hypothetical protein